MRWGLAVFGTAMAGLAAWAFQRYGVSLVAAAAAVIAIACIAAMLYAWWLARRALRRVGFSPDESTGKTP
jgi:cation transporter-like permease